MIQERLFTISDRYKDSTTCRHMHTHIYFMYTICTCRSHWRTQHVVWMQLLTAQNTRTMLQAWYISCTLDRTPVLYTVSFFQQLKLSYIAKNSRTFPMTQSNVLVSQVQRLDLSDLRSSVEQTMPRVQSQPTHAAME